FLQPSSSDYRNILAEQALGSSSPAVRPCVASNLLQCDDGREMNDYREKKVVHNQACSLAYRGALQSSRWASARRDRGGLGKVISFVADSYLLYQAPIFGELIACH